MIPYLTCTAITFLFSAAVLSLVCEDYLATPKSEVYLFMNIDSFRSVLNPHSFSFPYRHFRING